jgi:hypothetical protein
MPFGGNALRRSTNDPVHEGLLPLATLRHAESGEKLRGEVAEQIGRITTWNLTNRIDNGSDGCDGFFRINPP